MKLRLLIVCLVWAVGSGAGVSQQPQPTDSWKEYAYPQDGVAISAPEEPVVVNESDHRMYVSTLPNGGKLALMVMTVAGMSDQEVRDSMREGLVHDKTIEPSSIAETTVAGNAGFRAVRLFPKARYSVRAVYIGGRMIKLEALEGPEGERFLNSLRLVDPEWKQYSYPAHGFRLSSPAEPQLKEDSSSTEYIMDVPAGGYIVLHIPMQPAHDPTGARAALLRFRDSMGEKWQGKLAAESTLDSEFPGIAFDYEVPTGIKRISGQMYYAGSTVYVLLARGKAEPDRFFRAFHIISPGK
ncbi:MAG TPA: hypothetical protein VIB39_07210 [Candidatus Angelobacter sp.]|jgi:hypothetical protein